MPGSRQSHLDPGEGAWGGGRHESFLSTNALPVGVKTGGLELMPSEATIQARPRSGQSLSPQSSCSASAEQGEQAETAEQHGAWLGDGHERHVIAAIECIGVEIRVVGDRP